MSLRGLNDGCINEGHTPVMLHEVLQVLSPRAGAVYVDGTFGGGGYTKALLESADCQVVAIDRDPEAILRAHQLQKQYPGRLFVHEGCFSQMDSLIESEFGPKIAGIILDIGVSSFQLSDETRGFSFSKKGPLDMRMSQTGLSAKDVVNTYKEEDLANIFYEYGEERKSRAVARRIVLRREERPFMTTEDLRNVVHSVLPKTSKIDSATRVFQALRIYVNEELQELKEGLGAATRLLTEGGILGVVTFHSLEDRIVKNFFKVKDEGVSRYLPSPVSSEAQAQPYTCPGKQPLLPTQQETDVNPRARSAKLRWGTRVNGEIRKVFGS